MMGNIPLRFNNVLFDAWPRETKLYNRKSRTNNTLIANSNENKSADFCHEQFQRNKLPKDKFAGITFYRAFPM